MTVSPPRKDRRWLTVEIDWTVGKVLDDFYLTEEGRAAGAAEWRVLLLHRLAVEKPDLWGGPKPLSPSLDPSRMTEPTLPHDDGPTDRPDGVSERAWQNYSNARSTPGFPDRKGSISGAARAIVQRDPSKTKKQNTVRRDLYRVREAIEQKNK
jgi:hypothetical protein